VAAVSDRATSSDEGRGALAHVVDTAVAEARHAPEKVFPRHRTFLLGEIAMFSFLVLVVTGVYLALFYEASAARVSYDGSYEPLAGLDVPLAYRSVMEVTFDTPGGVVVRQTHHWAAIVFVAALALHAMRIFFTGAFRRPRRLNWTVGLTLLVLALGAGFFGLALPHDLLGGTGARNGHAVVLSIPVIGPGVADLLFAGEFGNAQMLHRFWLLHVIVFPVLIGLLLAFHLTLVWLQTHTQFPGDGGADEVVGDRAWPVYALKATALLIGTLGVLVTMGAVLQIAPIWLYGPFDPASSTVPAQPDWYLGWVEGALRIVPSTETTVWRWEIPNPFFVGALLPAAVLAVLYAWPFLEERVTGDRRTHHLLDRPREHPWRTALGAGGVAGLVVLVLAGSHDLAAFLIGVPIDRVTTAYRWLLVVAPPVAAAIAYTSCRSLVRAERERLGRADRTEPDLTELDRVDDGASADEGAGGGRVTRRARVAVGVMVVAVAAGGCAPEQGAFDPAGPAARDLAALFWAMTAAGVAVVLLVVALLAAARRGERAPADDDRPSELDAHTVAQRDRRSTRLVVGGGILLPMVVLVPLAVTMLAVADRLSPRAGDAYEIEIVGHQFWWELRYPNGAVTANEIHVPVGEPVRLVMTSADVIHSVWVPELAGKIDMIPGETTELVIEADTPGEYLGQCTEFCGAQHARMRFLVIAQDRSTFDAWLARQARPTAPPGTAEAAAGAEVFVEVGVRELPHGARHAGRRRLGSGPHPRGHPTDPRSARDRQRARPARRMDRRSAGDQAGRTDAAVAAERRPAERARRLPGAARMTLTPDANRSTTGDATGHEASAELHRIWSSTTGVPGFLTAVNHKQIGARFIWTGIAFLLLGGVEGLLIRLQLARSESTLLSPEAYNQTFTLHGTTMMFLFAVPVLEGLAMYLTPLQVGTRDLPLPRLNALGYWLYLAGGLLLNWSILTGSIPDGGWFAYVPLSSAEFSPTRSIDYWLLGVTFVEIAGIIGAVELIVLILRFRAPGMSLGRMPLFVWSVLVMAAMMLVAFPFVIAASLLLELERKFGAPFYDPAGGGNPLLWQHLFWIFGHPEVYIMLVPATGMVSAVVAAHVGRRVVAYPLVVASLIGIGVVSFGLWVHHMFAVGLPVMVLSLFAVASYAIAVPSGIQVFAWIATIWEGRPRWTAAMWFVAGFVVIFVTGGVTGVMVATAPWDLQAHDTFFVVAHLHYVLVGGVVFPMFAAILHWFPKMTGRMPGDVAGKVACATMFVGFNVAFMPQHWLGLQGMARRVYTYDAELGWDGWNLVSTVGAFVLAGGVAVYLANLAWAWRRGAIAGDDPWHGDSLEWATPSPPPFHNFDSLPVVSSAAPRWERAPTELRPDVAAGVAALSEPWGDRREVLLTSVVDARPEQIVTLPGPSPWPLLTTVAFTVGVVGVLVDWLVLVVAGGASTLAAVVAWGVGNRRPPRPRHRVRLDDPAAAARRRAGEAFARHTEPGRGAVWWATLLGASALGTVASALVYAYFYLRLDAEQWPLDGGDPAPLSAPLLGLVAVVLAVVTAPTLGRGRLRGGVSWLLVGGAIGVQLGALAASGETIDADAYGAAVVTLEVASAVLLAIAWTVRAAALTGGEQERRGGSVRDADDVTFVAAAGLWLAVWLVVHGVPRWL
jgi:cytochrome c oxidase subunit I+III